LRLQGGKGDLRLYSMISSIERFFSFAETALTMVALRPRCDLVFR